VSIPSRLLEVAKRVTARLGLLRVGSMAESMGLYLSAMILQKSIGLGRILLFTYLLARPEYGLWGLGVLIFNLAAPLLTLGSNHGLVRYVSAYEARGRLREFHRRMRLAVLACAACLTLVALAGSGLITRLVIASRDKVSDVAYRDQLHVCWAALANAMLLGLYQNLHGFLVGMRTYRLVAAMDLLFAVVFTAAGSWTLLVEPTALGLLLAHLGSLALTLAVGTVLLELGLARAEKPPPEAETETEAFADRGAPARVFRYGLAALVGTLLWHAAVYLSFYLTNRRYGKAQAGGFCVYLMLGQTLVFVGNAAWAVVFSHVARLWEGRQRPRALLTLQAAYKAVSLALLTVAVVVYAAAPVWVKLLSPAYRPDQKLLGGLLMFFQVLNHLALMSMLSKLHERPIVIAAALLAGAAANVALAAWWMPRQGAVGAAWAAGVGMYVGGGGVSLAYLLTRRPRLNVGSYLVLLLPAVLLLPVRLLGVAWAGVVALAAFTPVVFSRRQKQLLAGAIRRGIPFGRGGRG